MSGIFDLIVPRGGGHSRDKSLHVMPPHNMQWDERASARHPTAPRRPLNTSTDGFALSITLLWLRAAPVHSARSATCVLSLGLFSIFLSAVL